MSMTAIPIASAGICPPEKAYKGYPHSGDLSVKQGAYEIDIGIVDFTDDNAKVDAAALTLMKLVLSQL